jgi:low temperature requirement protein LtrA
MGAAERRTSSVELLWDLVFVFAVTQVTTLLAHRATWVHLGQAMLLLALVWWAWSAFVWAANAQASDSPVLRACLLAATVLIFIAGLALPQAFSGEALLFVVSYALVRLLHLALYADAARQGQAAGASIAGFAVTVLIGMVLLVAGALVQNGVIRAVIWVLAAAIDYAGPAWLTREGLRSLQRVAVEHFSERYGSFVIICLGESVLAVGAGLGTAARPLTPGLVVSGALALLVAVGMWWTYFDRFAEAARERLRAHRDPVIAAADAYSYIHLIIVAGIIVFAAGVRIVVSSSASRNVALAPRLCLCGGLATYLTGLWAFRVRMSGERAWLPLVAAAASIVVLGSAASAPTWLVLGLLALLVAALCAVEVAVDRVQPAAGAPPS